MSKFASVSFAVVLLGSSAALAQPHGDRPSGYVPPSSSSGCAQPNINYIIDPASGRKVTQAQYRARYPWTNSATWTYDCASNLWTDHTAPPSSSSGCSLPNVNYIADPASGRTITQAQYRARYPWTNSATWTYDCASNLWTDHTVQPTPAYDPQSQNHDRNLDYGRERDRDRDRDRDLDYERDRDRDQIRDQDQDRDQDRDNR